MSQRFANSYWSSDYVTGVESLKKQLNLSLKQLHELRQLVFSYMNYYHANSQFLNKLAIDTSNTSFKVLDKQEPVPLTVRSSPSRAQQLSQRRTISQNHRKLDQLTDETPLTEPSATPGDSEVPVTMDVPITMYIKDLVSEASTLLSLASAIDREVLEIINDFIKHHEPNIRTSIDHLNSLVNDYRTTYGEVEKLKVDYSECKRAKEFYDNEVAAKKSAAPTEELSPETTPVTIVTTSSNDSAVPEDDDEDDEESNFEFPIFLGSCKVRSHKELAAFLNDIIAKVETIKRGFTLPGQKQDIFSSDDLCKFLVHRRPFKLNPTRLNLERFGQSLLDLKLITGTSLLNRKFKSEGMWFEWSDLALFISSEGIPSLKSPISTPEKKPKLMDAQTAVTGAASNTSKKFNDMFKSMKLSILHTNFDEKLEKIVEDYDEKYYDLHELKYLLEYEIFQRTQNLEKFEKMKIGLIYQSLTKLSEIIYNFTLNSTTRLHKFASELVSSINNPKNYENDFTKLFGVFSTGIYSPSIVSPDNFLKGHYSTTQANNNFQNLKLEFNLYKDIPLQLKNFQTDKDIHLLSFASLPFFVNQLVKLIESKGSAVWTNPINHQKYWSVKERVISAVNEESLPHLTVANETQVQQLLIEKVIEVLKDEDSETIINFFKNWLLEIGDSLIPCLIYDALIQLYKNKEDAEVKSELIKIISSIPRSNISSLVFILEHICVENSLAQIPNFGLSDEISKELTIDVDTSEVTEVVKSLNSMDAIGAVPFTHLILRPSPIKTSGGLKPPKDIYDSLLQDLLSVNVRSELFINLVSSEKIYLEKKQQEKHNLGLQKKVPVHPSPRRPLATTDSTMLTPKSPKLNSSESFSLRPFKTKQTPIPSPSASPRNLSRELLESKTPLRDRSSSGTFLSQDINVEFEK